MLKVGVIGVGTISEMHITPYLQNEDVELVALCDFHEERLAEKGKLLSVNQLYDNYQELLNNQDINTILNVTPQIDNLGFDFVKSFGNEINHFVECCQSGNKTIAPVSDGVEVMKMLNAIYESAKIGKEVYL